MQNKRYKNKKHCLQSWTLSFKKMVKRDDFKQPVDTSNDLFWHCRILKSGSKGLSELPGFMGASVWVVFGKENPAPD